MLQLYLENNYNVNSVDEFKYNTDSNHNYMCKRKERIVLYTSHFLDLSWVLCWDLVVKVKGVGRTLKTFILKWFEYFILIYLKTTIITL